MKKSNPISRQIRNHMHKPILHKKLPFGILWTAKSGCTFLWAWFFFQLNRTQYKRIPIHQIRRCHYDTKAFQNAVATDKKWYKVVRNPFDRATSSYIHACRHKYDDAGISKFLGEPPENIDKKGFTFRQYITYLRDCKDTNIHGHPQNSPLDLILQPTIIDLRQMNDFLRKLEQQYNLKPANFDELHKITKSTTIRVNFNFFTGDTKFRTNSPSLPSVRSSPVDRKEHFPLTTEFYDDSIEAMVLSLFEQDFQRYQYKPTLCEINHPTPYGKMPSTGEKINFPNLPNLKNLPANSLPQT